MEKFLISELVEVLDGKLEQRGKHEAVVSVSIDSRKVTEGGLYVPIIGENMDGHRFVGNAVENGAFAVLTQENLEDISEDVAVIHVESTKKALQDLGKANRLRYTIPVVAVTGSSGKTTTKDVIASVLSQKYKTMKTQGNFNNQLGVPQTLFQLDPTYEAAVVEMGMDHLGDIRENIEGVVPHYGVITNIGTAHLEYLKTQDNILKAKMEIFETRGKDDIAILNGDDPYLNNIKYVPYQIIRFGIKGENLDYQAKDIQSSSNGVEFTLNEEKYHFRFPGIHNVYNATAAIIIAKDLGLTYEEIQKGFDAFIPSGNRMKMEVLDNVTYIDDSYNANPDSVRAAANTMAALKKDNGRCIAVIGDMLEMGETGWDLHYQVGQYISSLADKIIGVGDLAQAYIEGASEKMDDADLFYCGTPEEAAEYLKKSVCSGDVVLIKASHGVQLDKIMNILKGEN